MLLCLFRLLHKRHCQKGLCLGLENSCKEEILLLQVQQEVLPRLHHKMPGIASGMGRGEQGISIFLMQDLNLILNELTHFYFHFQIVIGTLRCLNQ